MPCRTAAPHASQCHASDGHAGTDAPTNSATADQPKQVCALRSSRMWLMPGRNTSFSCREAPWPGPAPVRLSVVVVLSATTHQLAALHGGLSISAGRLQRRRAREACWARSAPPPAVGEEPCAAGTSSPSVRDTPTNQSKTSLCPRRRAAAALTARSVVPHRRGKRARRSAPRAALNGAISTADASIIAKTGRLAAHVTCKRALRRARRRAGSLESPIWSIGTAHEPDTGLGGSIRVEMSESAVAWHVYVMNALRASRALGGTGATTARAEPA